MAIHGMMPLGFKIFSIFALIAMTIGVYYAIDKVYISARKSVKEVSLKADEATGRKYLFVSSAIRILFSLFLLYLLFSVSLEVVIGLNTH